MKEYSFVIDKYQYDSIAKAVRSRFAVISTWMEIVKLVINYYPPDVRLQAGSVQIRSSTMKRLFVLGPDRMFSLAFPFHIKFQEGQYFVESLSHIKVDSSLTSHMLTFMRVLEAGSIDSEWALTSFLDENVNGVSDFWMLFLELLNAEDGYLRFDHDEVRENGNLHPLDHVDLFYSNSATFKIGFHSKIEIEHAIDLLNLETDCYYLSQVKAFTK